MVKKLLLTIVAALGMSQFLYSQGSLLYGIFPLNNRKISYEKNIRIDSVGKDELFKRVQKWAIDTYKDQKDTTQIEDKTQGLLSYRGFVTAMFNEPSKNIAAEWNCWYDIKILCTNNKAKVIVTDLEQKSPSGYGNLTNLKIERIKSKTDSLPKAVFFGKNSKELYWKAQLVTLREIDSKIKAVITSLEKSIN